MNAPANPSADEPTQQPPITDPARRRELIGVIVIVLGILVLVWAVLFMTSQSLGTHVLHGFSERRTYNETKSAVHAAIPGMIWRACLGALLVWIGGRLRTAKR